MARNMKMELHTFSLILYQSKKCGHRIHVLFMMYDVYWYCQIKKKRMIMKILKKEWFIWKFWKKGGSREKGGGGNEIHAPCACDIIYLLWQIISEFWNYFPKGCPLGLYVKYLYQMWICAEGVSMLVVTNFQCKQ